MAPWKAHNRGIDNAIYADVLRGFANTGLEPRPTAIILYAGENDIAVGIPVRTVMRDLSAFLEMRGRIMTNVPVLVLSMKPSPGRWRHFRKQQLFNAAAQRLLSSVPHAHFGDITGPLLAGGHLGNNYRADGIHMNADGYKIWASVVRERLRNILPEEVLKSCDPA